MIHAENEPSRVKVSVVIVSWNHRSFLPKCLEALSAQTYPFFKIIIVDNASNDGSAQWIHAYAPFVHLICMDSNTGFSVAFNLAVKTNDSDFLLSLNPDVFVRPDFIANIVAAMEQDSTIGIVAPKLLRADDNRHLDSTGLFINRQRRPYDRGQRQLDHGQFDDKIDIFGACGAAALYRRTMLEDLAINQEYLDEDFFAYYEDADLAWRAKLRGWRCVFTPNAVAEHVRGWGDTLRKRSSHTGIGPRLALRNHFLMIVKNDSSRSFLLDALFIIGADILRLLYMLIFRWDALKGIVEFFHLAPKAKEKRKIIQNNRLVNERDLRHWFTQHA